MTETTHDRTGPAVAVAKYVALRAQIEDPTDPTTWTALADLFTDDAVYIDPAWGRIEGIDEIRSFLHDSMVGLDDWAFPIEFTAIDGNDVVIKWTQVLPGVATDGCTRTQSGWSRLVYAGGEKFRYEEDLLNMVEVLDDLKAVGWKLPANFHFPPDVPNRNASIPEAT